MLEDAHRELAKAAAKPAAPKLVGGFALLLAGGGVLTRCRRRQR